MDLGTTQQILLILLASFLAIFLIVGIIIGVFVIKLLRTIRHITQKAEAITDKADAVASFFQQSAGPAAIAKLVSNIVHSVREHADNRKSDKR